MRIYPLLLSAAACTGADTGIVSVTVQHAPPSTAVVFLAADDSVVATMAPDADGLAQASMEAGGSVSVYIPDSALPSSVYTYAGVELGDAYAITLPDPDPVLSQLTIDVPEYPGTTKYIVRAPCAYGESATTTVAVSGAGCASATDFYVEAQTPTATVSFLSRDVALASAISLAGASYVVPSPITLSAINVPDATDPFLSAQVLDGDWVIAQGTIGGSSYTFDLPVIPGAELALQFQIDDSPHGQMFARRVPFASGTGDFAANLMPWIDAVTTSGDDVSWTEHGGGPIAIDGVVITTGSPTCNHFTSARDIGAAVRVPHLPAPYDACNLVSGALMYEVDSIGLGVDYETYRLGSLSTGEPEEQLWNEAPSDAFAHGGITLTMM